MYIIKKKPVELNSLKKASKGIILFLQKLYNVTFLFDLIIKFSFIFLIYIIILHGHCR